MRRFFFWCMFITPLIAGLAWCEPAFAAEPSAAPTATIDERSNVDALVGWPAGPRVVDERRWEDRFMTVPSAANAIAIEQHLSAVPHRAGTPADYATANFVSERLKADGFNVSVVPFEVLYTNPISQSLELVAPTRMAFDLLEGDPAHHTEQERLAGPAFMENSGDGDVTGPLFYLNHGTADDWATFDDLKIAIPAGAIVIERLGGATRDPGAGAKNWKALKKHGVAGLIVYEDVADDGVYGGVAWPNGNWKNPYMAERIGGPRPGVAAIAPPGDPTLPGEAPIPGKRHLAWERTDHADIPEINVTQAVARKLLGGMTGAVVPEGWHDGFEMLERVGGNESVRLAVKMERRLTTIWNVIGTMRGAKRPDQVVMMGSHRDAMAFGAIDPGSGTTVMLQVADGFKTLHAAGWRPDRTIQVASWDGHELGLWGSLSLAYARGPELRSHVVQYVNTDQLTTGTPYRASMSPELWGFGREIASLVKGIDGRPLLASETAKKPVLVPPRRRLRPSDLHLLARHPELVDGLLRSFRGASFGGRQHRRTRHLRSRFQAGDRNRAVHGHPAHARGGRGCDALALERRRDTTAQGCRRREETAAIRRRRFGAAPCENRRLPRCRRNLRRVARRRRTCRRHDRACGARTPGDGRTGCVLDARRLVV